MNLAEAKLGQKFLVKKVHGSGPVKRRIMEMGVTKGAEISVDKIAPLGDPCNFKLRDYDLCLRKEDACKIEVEPVLGV